MAELQSLAGRVALVTGASSGIGKASALALARSGADVALNYFSMPDEAKQTAEEIRSLGRKALLFELDVSSQTAVEQMTAEIVSQWGQLNLLVTAAAFSERESFLTANLADFHKTIDVSFWGAFYCLRAACGQMVKQGQGGSCVIVSSPHGQIAFPNCMAYNISKAALDMMMKTAATELLPHRIRVNCVYPGWTDTPGERKYLDDAKIREAAKGLPWGRLASAEEIARAVQFLAEPGSDYITGTILHTDGGLFLPWWSRRGTGEF